MSRRRYVRLTPVESTVLRLVGKGRPVLASGEVFRDCFRRRLIAGARGRGYRITPLAERSLKVFDSDRHLKPPVSGNDERSAAEEAFWSRCPFGREGALRRALDRAWAVAEGRVS